MTLSLFSMVTCFLITIALLAWELVVTRRERDEARHELVTWYGEALKQRRMRERAELGYGDDVPPFLFPVPNDHETITRRIGLRDGQHG